MKRLPMKKLVVIRGLKVDLSLKPADAIDASVLIDMCIKKFYNLIACSKSSADARNQTV